MQPLSRHRKIQLVYLLTDILTAELVWLCFLVFRWLVYDGYIWSIDTILIPAFNYYVPLVLYPLGCLITYYLSGFYLRPVRKNIWHDIWTTLWSSMLITLVVFFVIVIDDVADDYTRYVYSLWVLMGLQFGWCLFGRLFVTSLVNSHYAVLRVFTLRTEDDVDRFRRLTLVQPQDEVVIDLQYPTDERLLYKIIGEVYPYGVAINVVPRLFDMIAGSASISDVEDTPLIRITQHKMSDAELCVKRACDVVLSSIALVVLSPILIALAIAVKQSSGGSVLYRQERIGQYGIPFRILKFRTMYPNAEPSIPQLSGDHDPRITAVGKVLRRYRLDELPQLWNIIRGEMSIVGPRPERNYFIRQIEEKAPYYCLIYKIRPGLTSWGPIKVGYTDTVDKMVQRLNYDIVYMENMSLKLDVKILFYTLGVICDGKGK